MLSAQKQFFDSANPNTVHIHSSVHVQGGGIMKGYIESLWRVKNRPTF